MYIKNGEYLRVKLDLIFKCKRCGEEYHMYEESIQPDKEHIDKYVEFILDRIKEHPLNYCHICYSLPNNIKKYGRVSSLDNTHNTAYINYGIGELLGFNVDFDIQEGEG